MANINGFTLIELLVVVVITAILAAISLPVYTNNIERARAAEAISTLQVLEAAQKRYFLVNGAYATDIRTLDISIPSTSNTTSAIGKHFRYYVTNSTYVAYAIRLPTSTEERTYYIRVYLTGQRLRCLYYNTLGQDRCRSIANLVDNY